MLTTSFFTSKSPMEQYPSFGPKATTASPYSIRKAVASPKPLVPERSIEDIGISLHIPKGLESKLTGLGQKIDITV